MADLFTTDISGNVRPGFTNTNIPFGGTIGMVNVRGVVISHLPCGTASAGGRELFLRSPSPKLYARYRRRTMRAGVAEWL